MTILNAFHNSIMDNLIHSDDQFMGISQKDKEILVEEFILGFESRLYDLWHLVEILRDKKNSETKLASRFDEVKKFITSKITHWTTVFPFSDNSLTSYFSLPIHIKEQLYTETLFMLALLHYLTEKTFSEWKRIEKGGLPENEDIHELDLPKDALAKEEAKILSGTSVSA